MSAAVCGSKRSFFEELPPSPPVSKRILERALQEHGNDLDAAIKSLDELCLESTEGNSGRLTNDGNVGSLDNLSTSNHLPVGGQEWVDLFVREMMCASSMDDAKARAARLLEILEESISSRAGEATKTLHKENLVLKEQIEGLMRENSILKRAVAIQHERQKEYDDRNLELQHFKQLVTQYQEQLRTLEMSNYALTMHLKHANQSSSIPGRFHPDVF
ncbi:uncharacterized protein LOC122301134 isoform X4 [Carya illinoinensis]|uniref:uncharacterized protein LOC122301134 isoform X4 n=1 Tax=Carya illinoinensis TaxID=32201 RepID=UPI001C721D61|nr:uncharacterized protein LOC122301134 isoform X4 [Carya illinoinensis]